MVKLLSVVGTATSPAVVSKDQSLGDSYSYDPGRLVPAARPREFEPLLKFSCVILGHRPTLLWGGTTGFDEFHPPQLEQFITFSMIRLPPVEHPLNASAAASVRIVDDSFPGARIGAA